MNLHHVNKHSPLKSFVIHPISIIQAFQKSTHVSTLTRSISLLSISKILHPPTSSKAKKPLIPLYTLLKIFWIISYAVRPYWKAIQTTKYLIRNNKFLLQKSPLMSSAQFLLKSVSTANFLPSDIKITTLPNSPYDDFTDIRQYPRKNHIKDSDTNSIDHDRLPSFTKS